MAQGQGLKKLYVELSTRCNLQCRHCFRQGWEKAPADMSPVLFSALLQQLDSLPALQTVVLGGVGEPTLSPLFTEAMTRFSGYRLLVTSNAVDWSPAVVAALANHADMVAVSVDGLSGRHQERRGSDLGGVLENLSRLRRAAGRRPKPRPLQLAFQFVLSRSNAADGEAVVALAAAEKANLLIVSHVLPQCDSEADQIMYARYGNDECRNLFQRMQARALRLGLNIRLPRLELKTERRCNFAEEGAAYASVDGALCPCYRFAHDGQELVFGRLKQVGRHSFAYLSSDSPIAADAVATAWESGSWQNFRNTLINNRYPSCPDCDLLDGCNIVEDTRSDCWSGAPSCADCLWARGFLQCI